MKPQKKYILILLLFASFFGLAQTDTVSKHSSKIILPKNELDLDIEPVGVHLSYKRQIYKRLYIGVAVGAGILSRLEYDYSQLRYSGALDFAKAKVFLDVQITKRLHIYEAGTLSGGLFNDHDDGLSGGIAYGLEAGFFYRITNILEIGYEPAVVFRPHSIFRKSVSLSLPIFTLRFRLVK